MDMAIVSVVVSTITLGLNVLIWRHAAGNEMTKRITELEKEQAIQKTRLDNEINNTSDDLDRLEDMVEKIWSRI